MCVLVYLSLCKLLQLVMGCVLVYLSLRTVLELVMVCLHFCAFHFYATVTCEGVFIGVYVTPYANVFCYGVCIGVFVTLYTNVAGDDACVLICHSIIYCSW